MTGGILEVLMIEDSPSDQLLTKKIFHAADICAQFTIACDGEAAVRMIETWSESGHPDLVILDLNLPKVDGHDVLRCIEKKGLNVPVAVLTGSSTRNDMERAKRLGAIDYIVKPMGMEEFDETIGRFRTLVESLKIPF